MNKFYIVDTTQRKEPFIFENTQGLVKHLEGTVQRKFGQTRANYMQNLIDMGHGYDVPNNNNYNCSILTYDHNADGFCDGLSINGWDGISFCTGANTRNEKMRISSDGNVGIQNTSPWVDLLFLFMVN